MPAKSKQSTAVVEKMTPTRKTKARAQVIEMPKADRSPPDVARQWEQIRLRGEQISADIKVLLARLS